MRKFPFDLNVVILLILLAGVILAALWILENPTGIERWVTFVGASAGFIKFFKEVADEFLEGRYSKGGPNKKIATSSHDSTLTPDIGAVRDKSNPIAQQRLNFFKYFLIIVVGGAVGAGCIALATVDYSETLFFVALLPALIGSIGLVLLIDICGEMQNDPLWQRLASAVLWGALGAFVGIIIIAIVLLYFMFKGGSGPTNIDFHR